MTGRERAERVVGRCRELARVTDVQGETTRTFLSAGMRRANEMVGGWMSGAGMRVRVDAAGNLRGLLGPESGPRFVIGSHLDTVRNAGAFDGPLGVVLGIEVVDAMREGLEFGVEVIGFSEEEGVRFGAPYLGSRAVVGKLDARALGLRDAAGVSVGEAIAGYGLDVRVLSGAGLSAGTFGYVEVHLEQGPVLEAEGRAVAAVRGIAGQTRMRVRFEGQANHAGTTPMSMRHDALAAAAEWISGVEREALGTSGLVATVGSITAEPGLGNVVAGGVTCSLDVRHAEDGVRVAAVERVLAGAKAAGAKRGVGLTWQVVLEQVAVGLDERLRQLMEECAGACGCDGRAVVSGAGHDAGIVAERVPSAMLFVRTPGGVSHHPDEAVAVEDVETALRVTMEFLGRLGPGSRRV